MWAHTYNQNMYRYIYSYYYLNDFVFNDINSWYTGCRCMIWRVVLLCWYYYLYLPCLSVGVVLSSFSPSLRLIIRCSMGGVTLPSINWPFNAIISTTAPGHSPKIQPISKYNITSQPRLLLYTYRAYITGSKQDTPRVPPRVTHSRSSYADQNNKYLVVLTLSL